MARGVVKAVLISNNSDVRKIAEEHKRPKLRFFIFGCRGKAQRLRALARLNLIPPIESLLQQKPEQSNTRPIRRPTSSSRPGADHREGERLLEVGCTRRQRTQCFVVISVPRLRSGQHDGLRFQSAMITGFKNGANLVDWFNL